MSQNLGTPTKPMDHFGERLSLEVRTTDPATTSEGEAWIRSDLTNSGEWLATFRYDDGTQLVNAPILTAGDSESYSEALRIPVGGTQGYLPIETRSNATHPAWSFQKGSQTYAITEPSAIPEGSVHRWIISSGSGSVDDIIGSESLSLNTPTRVSGEWKDGYALDFDGSGDSATTTSTLSAIDQNTTFSIALTLVTSDASTVAGVVEQLDSDSTGFTVGLDGGNIIGRDWSDNSSAASLTADGLTKQRCVVTYNNPGISVFVNTTEGSVSDQISNSNSAQNFTVGEVAGNYFGGQIDDIIIYDHKLTQSEIQSDYDIQPWS